MTTEMVDSVGSSVVVISPENSVKVPRTLLIRWRAVKPTVGVRGVDGPGAGDQTGLD